MIHFNKNVTNVTMFRPVPPHHNIFAPNPTRATGKAAGTGKLALEQFHTCRNPTTGGILHRRQGWA